MSVEAKKDRLSYLCLSIAVLVQIPLLAAPFNDGSRGACGAFFSLMARHFVRSGLVETGGIPLLNPTEDPAPEEMVYYRHHPPGIPLLVAGSFALFGESESAARAVALVLLGVLLYATGRLTQLDARGGAWFVVALMAAVPLGAYYGPFVNFEIPCLAGWCLTLTFFASWRMTGRTHYLAFSFAAYLIGGLLDWPIFLAAPFLSLLALKSAHANRKKVALAFPVLALALYGLVSVWQSIQVSRHGSFPEGDGEGFLRYLLNVSPLAKDLDLGLWVLSQAEFLWRYAWITGPLALLGTVVALVRRTDSRPWLLTTLSVAFLNIFLFAPRSLTHDYYILYFLPWLGLGVRELWLLLPPSHGLRWLAALALVGALIFRSQQVIQEGQTSNLASKGKELAEVLTPDEVALIQPPWDLQVPYYARRAVFPTTTPLPLLLEELKRYSLVDKTLWIFSQRELRTEDVGPWKAFWKPEKVERRNNWWAYPLEAN